MTIIDFLEKCGVNPFEKIDREGDSYWRLNELIEHYLQDVINSSEIIRPVSDAPTFEEWVSKYFEKPQVTTIYKVKNQSEHLTIEEMIKKYNKAYSGGR